MDCMQFISVISVMSRITIRGVDYEDKKALQSVCTYSEYFVISSTEKTFKSSGQINKYIHIYILHYWSTIFSTGVGCSTRLI